MRNPSYGHDIREEIISKVATSVIQTFDKNYLTKEGSEGVPGARFFGWLNDILRKRIIDSNRQAERRGQYHAQGDKRIKSVEILGDQEQVGGTEPIKAGNDREESELTPEHVMEPFGSDGGEVAPELFSGQTDFEEEGSNELTRFVISELNDNTGAINPNKQYEAIIMVGQLKKILLKMGRQDDAQFLIEYYESVIKLGYDHKDIAKSMNIKPNTYNRRWIRLRADLVNLWDKESKESLR